MIGISFSDPLSYPWGFAALLGPVFMYWILVYVTGIPPLEEQMLRSRGDRYRDYQSRTSEFFPLPPERSNHELRLHHHRAPPKASVPTSSSLRNPPAVLAHRHACQCEALNAPFPRAMEPGSQSSESRKRALIQHDSVV